MKYFLSFLMLLFAFAFTVEASANSPTDKVEYSETAILPVLGTVTSSLDCIAFQNVAVELITAKTLTTQKATFDIRNNNRKEGLHAYPLKFLFNPNCYKSISKHKQAFTNDTDYTLIGYSLKSMC